MFPELDGFVATATAEFPEGTPPEITTQAIQSIEAALLRLAEKTPTTSGKPLLESRLALVGQTLGDMVKTGPNLGAVQAIMLDSEERGMHANDIMVAWEKEVGLIPGIKSLTLVGTYPIADVNENVPEWKC